MFMCSLPCLYLDLYVGVLLAMFMCLDLHVGCYTMCFYNPFCLLLYLFISMFACLDLGFTMIWPSVACACWSLGPLAGVVASVPFVACLDVTACENASS